MIDYDLKKEDLILHVRPQGKLSVGDFKELSSVVDPIVLEKGMLRGLIIETERFPGWKNISALVEHIKFVKSHHRKIEKIALVTDTKFANLAEKIGPYFLKPEVKKFPKDNFEKAKNWITQASYTKESG